jgi:ferredoxin
MKLVKHEALVIDENCTGCYRCDSACPTGAITMVGPRREAIAVIDRSRCVACGRCLDVCPDDAIEIADRDDPFEIGTDPRSVDQEQLLDLCRKAGLDPDAMACVCANAPVKELAAAVLSGATNFDELAIATGSASGCLMYCGVPMRALLAAHLDREPEETKVRRVGSRQTVFDIPAELADRYPLFSILGEQAAARAEIDAFEFDD